jgi:hypothetical protein
MEKILLTDAELRLLLHEGEARRTEDQWCRRFFDLDSSPPKYCTECESYDKNMDDFEGRGHVPLSDQMAKKILFDLATSNECVLCLKDVKVFWEGRERTFEAPSWHPSSFVTSFDDATIRVTIGNVDSRVRISIHDTIQGS